MSPNLTAARRHLWMLTEDEDAPVAWQTFHDSDKGRRDLARSFHGRLDDVLPQLTEAQVNGCGVFVAVNETDGHGRRIENIRSCRAVFLDLDGAPLPDEWPVRPTIINKSSNGKAPRYHCWWAIEPIEPTEAWKAMQHQLAVKYNGDTKCTILTQVGRLAGFLHQKDPDNPWPVTIIEDHVDELDDFGRPTLSELASAFGFDLEVRPERERKQVKEPPHGWDDETDVERARRIVADEHNWKATSDGGFSVFRMAARLRDMGISPETARDLIVDHIPTIPSEWPEDHIERRVENAYRYASGDAGAQSAAAAVDDFEDDLAPEDYDPEPDTASWFAEHFRSVGQRDITQLPRTPWLTEGLALYREVTAIAGRGGVGKSTHAWHVGVATAAGIPFAMWPAPERARKVLVLSGEDDYDEIERRVSAACQSLGVDRAELVGRFLVVDRNIRLAVKDQAGRVTRTKLWRAVRWAVQNLDIGLVIVDPLIKASSGFKESDNDDQEELFDTIRALTEGHDCAALVDDHFAKGGVGGDQSAVRGASSKVDASRVSITLAAMSEKDWRRLGPPRSRDVYVQVQDPKQNYARKRGAHWLQLVEYPVGNGEVRPALRAVDLSAGQDFLDPQSWQHREAFLRLVMEGRDEASQKGWPWCSAKQGRRDSRLDSAVAEMFDLRLRQARDWIQAFADEGSIIEEDWVSPQRNESKVWRVNKHFEETTE